MMMSEVLQVLRGVGKVGSALVTTQGEQLRLMVCNSTVAAGVKAAQDAVEGLVGTVMGGTAMQQSIKEDVFPDAEGWEEMDPEEAAKWAVGSEFPSSMEEARGMDMPSGVPSTPGTGPGGAGWPGQSARLLHISPAMHYAQARFLHDSVVARLTPEDIKKAREAKKALARPAKQRVGLL